MWGGGSGNTEGGKGSKAGCLLGLTVCLPGSGILARGGSGSVPGDDDTIIR